MSNKIIYKENEKEIEIDFNDLENIKDIEIIEEDEEWEEGSIRGKIVAITPFICIIVYLLLGFYKNLWHPGWIIFLLIPIVPLFIKMFSGSRGSLIAFFNLIIIGAYFVLGFLYNWWHPGWIIFLLIPVISIILSKKNN